MSKSGFVCILGRPNVGKSTLLNSVLEDKVSITSDKPQTTRERIRGIYTDEPGQIVFIDTPGVNRPKNKLGSFMEKEIQKTSSDADLILFMIEPDIIPGPGDKHIIARLPKDIPVFLVINKTDTVAKEDILPVIDNYRKLFDFKEIFPICAKTGEGVKPLLSYIFENIPEGPMFYSKDEITDMPIRNICAEFIREKALMLLEEELPHGIAVLIDEMKLNNRGNLYHISATIICEKKSHKGMIIGKSGNMLKKIGSLAREDMEKLVNKKVNLKLWVSVKDNWRDSERLIKNFGYREDK